MRKYRKVIIIIIILMAALLVAVTGLMSPGDQRVFSDLYSKD